MTPVDATKPSGPALAAPDQALIDDLDRVLREAFAQPATVAIAPAKPAPPSRPVMPSRAPAAPVMLPMPEAVSDPAPPPEGMEEKPASGSAAGSEAPRASAPYSKPAAATQQHAALPPPLLKPVDTDEVIASAPKSVTRSFRPLPSLEDTVAPPPPIEPISMAGGRARRWRPAVAVTAMLAILAISAHFLMRNAGMPLPATTDAPPLIVAPATPTVIPAPHIATETSPAPPAAIAAAPVPQPPLSPQPPASQPAMPQPTTTAPPAVPAPSAPVVESAGILGDPQVSPFDTVLPSRTVRTTVVAANEASTAPEQPVTPAKPLVLSDPTTWPAGATVAEPHPLPPRRP